MSKTVDNRVVEMQFDNRQFESNVKTSMSTLDKLKHSLNMNGAAKGLESVNNAAKNTNLSVLSNGIETVRAKFSALQVAGVTALANITNSAVNAGKNMVSALTVDPIMAGFQEYETQINSVQTILANTQSKGTNLDQVNAALDELNVYADKTIYNFTEMTRNIGTFTAAGVGLNESVSAIKGISNLAAVSGSTSQQASQAMYQLSQALAAGKVSLMDWNSVVNAGMGGEVFQTALKRTATQMGHDVDGMIEKYGSFRESLTEGGWLTADVLTETLAQISGAYTEADLIAQGYSESQAKEIVQLAQTATDAATKVKTFTQLFDTLKEAAQSGWTQSWEIIVGDFEEAQELLTTISNTFGEMINSSAEARNNLLSEGLSSGWKQFTELGINDTGFLKDITTQVAKEHNVAIDDMIEKHGSFEKSLQEGWMTSDILAESVDKMTNKINNMSAEELKNAGYTKEQVKSLNELNDSIKNGTVDIDSYVKKMSMMSGRENIIQGLTNVFNGLMAVIKPIQEAFREVFPPATGEQLYSLTEKFKNFTETLKPSAEMLENIKRTAKGFFSIFSLVGKAIGSVLKPIGSFLGGGGAGGIVETLLGITGSIGDFFTTLNESAGVGNFFGGISEGLSKAFGGISEVISSATQGINGFGDVVSAVADTIGNVFGKIGEFIGSVFENISMGDIFAGLAGGGIFVLATKIGGVFGKIKEVIESIFGGKDDKGGGKLSQIVEGFNGVLDSLKGSLEAFTSGIKVASLVGIAVAIGILTMSLRKLSEIKSENMATGLAGIAALIAMLNASFHAMLFSLSKFNAGGIIKAGVALIAMATAINIFATALTKVAGLSVDEIARGLVALGVGLLELSVALKIIDKVNISLKTSVAIIALAKACQMLGDALAKFGAMSWEEIGRGLTAMGAALGELVASLAILSKVGGGGAFAGSAAIFVTVQSLSEMADSLKKFGEMSWDEIGRGLAAMGGALTELVASLAILSKVGGGGAVLGSAAIFIAVQGLGDIANALRKFGSMSWEEIGRGLVAMGGALLEVSGITAAVGKLAPLGALVGSGSLLIAVQGLGDLANAFQQFGSMSWEEIGRGLVAMGGALLEVSGITAAVGSLAPLGALVGSGSLLLAVQGLGDLAAAFQDFGSMSWDEIGRGLVAMGGALAEATGIPAIVGSLAPLGQAVGSGSLLLATQGLGDLANAFMKFGSMNWDEIGRGLAAMGGAMGETALGGLLNTFSGFGAGAIAEMAEPLGTLADSVQKWATVTVPEDLGGQLGNLAGGVFAFNFSGWGADAIAALASPLGTLADSIKKWVGVTVPEGMETQLSGLAKGVEAFNFAGWGGEAIASVATPLGDLAMSIGKWAKVTVPEDMQSSLENLAKGVKAFNFSGWGADDMGEVAGPLGDLATSVGKWDGIVLPEDMGTKLESLAKGLKAFNLGWGESFDVSGAIGPIGDLAGAVSKWNGVILPTSLGTALENLAKGIKSFKDSNPGDITGTCNALTSLGDAVQQISVIDFATVTTNLANFALAISNINVSADSFANLGNSIVTGIVGAINAGYAPVQAAVIGLVTSVTSTFIAIAASVNSMGAGLALVSGLASGILSGTGIASSATQSLIAVISGIATGSAAMFIASGLAISTVLGNSVTLGGGLVSEAVRSIVLLASLVAQGSSGIFFSAGYNLAIGFANGISSGAYAARIAASAMASAAANAARQALNEHSPSRVMYEIGDYAAQGFTNALDDGSSSAYDSGYSMADNARKGLSKAISGISDVLNSDMDTQPTITPVLNLDEVKSGAASVSGMFNAQTMGVTANISSIKHKMSQRNQNGGFEEVVGAVNKLRKDIGNLSTNSYNINGITYDDGSNIASAIETIARYAIMERRM